jgi:Protein of unknown function (DUF3102)
LKNTRRPPGSGSERGNDPLPPPPAPTDQLEDDEPVLEADEREALEDDEIELKTGLPEPQAPASPLTEEERDQRLEVIKARVIGIYPRYKKYARRMHTIMVEMGQLLIEAKSIVGHGRFATWVNDNCPFSHRTADNYMFLARTKLKFASVANLAERGTVDAVEAHFEKKSVAQSRKWKQEEAAERRAKLPQSPFQRKRQRKFASFLEKRIFNRQRHQAAQQARSEQYQAQDLQDLTKLWPRPHHDAARIEIELQLPDDVIQVIYVWLSEYGHADAKLATRKTSWKGSVALRYHWILCTKGNNSKDYSVAIDGRHFDGNYKTWTDGDTWEEVQAKLSELSQNATEVRRANRMDRDPATAGILDNWRESEIRR